MTNQNYKQLILELTAAWGDSPADASAVEELLRDYILDIAMEAVGEDEYPKEHFPFYLGHENGELAKRYDEVRIRDRFRAKVRTRIKQIVGGQDE